MIMFWNLVSDVNTNNTINNKLIIVFHGSESAEMVAEVTSNQQKFRLRNCIWSLKKSGKMHSDYIGWETVSVGVYIQKWSQRLAVILHA